MTQGTVYCARPLASGQLSTIENAFCRKLGEQVTLDMVVDASLIAGVNVVVEGVSYDGSVKGQTLRMLALLAGGNQQLGDPQRGDPHRGDPQRGDPHRGDPRLGDPEKPPGGEP